MTFIPFDKAHVETVLPEKRAQFIFTQPDVYMNFGDINTLYIYNDIIEDLDEQWQEKLTLWWGRLDFNVPDTEHDYDRTCAEYAFIDFAIIPEVSSLSETVAKMTPLAWDNKKIVINIDFISALKQAGAVDIWFDRLY